MNIIKRVNTKLGNYVASRRGLIHLVLASLLILAVLPTPAGAAQITGRKLTLSTSSASAGATVTYTFAFTVPTTGTVIKSWDGQVCTTPSGTCTIPTGFVNTATLNQPTGMGSASGWTANNATSGRLRILNNANATTPSGSQTVTMTNVTNPTTTNQTFYVRMTTYSDSAWTTAIDTGVVAASTANQITLTASVDESLSFCVGVTVTSNCSSTTGTSVALGTLSTTSTKSGTSQMAAATNAASGYNITINGTTLTSGANTIAAMGTQSANGAATTSSTGTAQFGVNLRANTTPSVGSDLSNLNGNSNGGYGTNYGTVDNFRFFTADSVANSNSGPSDYTTYTVSYIANISAVTLPGSYSATMTYICTATF